MLNKYHQLYHYNQHHEILIISAFKPEYSYAENCARNKFLFYKFQSSSFCIYSFAVGKSKANKSEIMVIVDCGNYGRLKDMLDIAKNSIDIQVKEFHKNPSNQHILQSFTNVECISEYRYFASMSHARYTSAGRKLSWQEIFKLENVKK